MDIGDGLVGLRMVREVLLALFPFFKLRGWERLQDEL